MSESNRAFCDKLYQTQSQKAHSQTITSLVANTFNFAVSHGVSEQQIQASTGISRTDLIHPETCLPGESVPIIWKLLGSVHPGEPLSLNMASAAPLSIYGPLAQCIQYAENLRSILQTLVQYRTILSTQLYLELVESDSEAFLRAYHPLDAIDKGYSAEAGNALTNRFIQQAIGTNEPLLRVELAHSPLGVPNKYENFFGVPVYFQQPYNALVFRREALDMPTQQPDDYLFRYIRGNLDLLQERWMRIDYSLSSLQSSSTESPLIQSPLIEIRETIARNAEYAEFSVEAIARHLNVSTRALQRLVQSHGITVRQLLDDVRETKARQLVANSTYNIQSISTQLGYSDDRAFRRAFKRWTGQTPTTFRQSHSQPRSL